MYDFMGLAKIKNGNGVRISIQISLLHVKNREFGSDPLKISSYSSIDF